MKTTLITSAILALLVASVAISQDAKHTPPSTNEASTTLAPLPDPQASPTAVVAAATAAPVNSGAQAPTSTAQPAPAAQSTPVVESPQTPAQPVNTTSTPTNEIRMNFQNAQLTDVLNYLSEAAGFVIVQDVPVTGTVNIVCKQSISANEAVDLLNTVLVEKGYAAIRNGRILKIVSSHDIQKHDLPVMLGSDPDKIPRKDEMVTQILPLRVVEAGKLVDNLRPLLSADATISSNENSNAIILTDTETNIHRIAEIIHSLDNSITSISSIHVFQLRYADAKDFANVLTQLFATDQGRTGQQQPQFPFFGRFGRGGGGGPGGGGAQANESESEARKAALRVVAVADTQTNSVVVSAPEEFMSTIADIVNRLDTSTTDVTQTRIFRLEHADSVELSSILNSLYSDTTTLGTGNNNNNNRPGQNGQRPPQPAQQTSQRALLQARVVAVPDPRTNSIIVNASADTMEQIALTIGRLDATDMKKQHVYVHVLEHADPDNVATILRGMFGSQASSSSSSQPASNALNQRTTTGASSDIINSMGSSGNGGGLR